MTSQSNRRFVLQLSRVARYRRRVAVRATAAVMLLALFLPGSDHAAYAADKLRFAVGPLQPTPTETKKTYDPFFKYLAETLGVDYTLDATTDWAGCRTSAQRRGANRARAAGEYQILRPPQGRLYPGRCAAGPALRTSSHWDRLEEWAIGSQLASC
jgi:hypothetical protein